MTRPRRRRLAATAPEDDGLVCHANTMGQMILVEPDKVHQSHAQRMAMFDAMRPEYRALINGFPRLLNTAELFTWSQMGVPVWQVRATLAERFPTLMKIFEDRQPMKPPGPPLPSA